MTENDSPKIISLSDPYGEPIFEIKFPKREGPVRQFERPEPPQSQSFIDASIDEIGRFVEDKLNLTGEEKEKKVEELREMQERVKDRRENDDDQGGGSGI